MVTFSAAELSVGFVRETVEQLLLPSEFNWENDAAGFYRRYNLVFVAAAVLYLPIIFTLQRWMKDRPAFELGGAKSTAIINWIFWWELSLSIFSVLGSCCVVPMVFASIQSHGFLGSMCGIDMANLPQSWWGFAFSVSKVVEMGDTVLVVLRKKPLILLQYYHHLATMLYCWYGTLVIQKINNTNFFFAALNFLVHSIMYTWYAATRTGWKSPKWLMMSVTMLQLVQMIGGIAVTVLASSVIQGTHCGRWATEDPVGNQAAFVMYASYLVLFAHMFYNSYIVKKKKPKVN